MPTTSPPLLPFGRAKPLIALCVHLAARSFKMSAPQYPAMTASASALATRLPTLLSRTYAPLVTKAALMHRPDVDLMWATRDDNLKLLKFMVDWSKEPEGRPLHYCSWQTVEEALELDSPRVLDGLLSQPCLFFTWEWGYQLANAMCGKGRVEWREWWQTSGLRRFKDRVSFADAAVEASRAGRLDILDWLLEELGEEGMTAIASNDSGSAMVAAAREGHVDVLDWWLDKVHSGSISLTINWVEVIGAGFDQGHVAVLEWCKRRPQAVEERQRTVNGKGLPRLRYQSMAYNFDVLAQGKDPVSSQASTKRNVEVVKELHARGDLFAAMYTALDSGDLDLLDWIHASEDPLIPDRTDGPWAGFEPFDIVCRNGNVNVLDWFFANGYHFPPSAEKRASLTSSAIHHGHFAVVKNLMRKGLVDNMSMRDWNDCVVSACENGDFVLLDLLESRCTGSSAPDPQKVAKTQLTGALRGAFYQGRVDVIEWWLFKSSSLKHLFDLNQGKPYLDACKNEVSKVETLSALETWHRAGQPIDYAECIHEASIHGRVDVLDWLLHSTSASEEDFVKAWSVEGEYEDPYGDLYAHYAFDIDNHGKSLGWWRATLPHDAALPVNRGPYENPIHAHYLQHMLNNSSVDLLDPLSAMCEKYGWVVGLLGYWKKMGREQELDQFAHYYLKVASDGGYLEVLDWWQASGLTMECPEDVLSGKTQIRKSVKEWWAKSGLVDDSQL